MYHYNISKGSGCRSGGDMDTDLRATYLALIIVVIVCALALSIDFIVER
jgi:hypothetical protein